MCGDLTTSSLSASLPPFFRSRIHRTQIMTTPARSARRRSQRLRSQPSAGVGRATKPNLPTEKRSTSARCKKRHQTIPDVHNQAARLRNRFYEVAHKFVPLLLLRQVACKHIADSIGYLFRDRRIATGKGRCDGQAQAIRVQVERAITVSGTSRATSASDC